MGLITGIVIIITSLYFFFKFPKQMFVLLGLIILGIITLWYFTEKLPNDKKKKLQDNITIALTYDTTNCGSGYPLFVKINNNSNEVVKKISWDLNVFNPGYSTELSGYNDDYTCDKILKPGEKWTNCYTLPYSIKKEEHKLSTLKYEIGYKSIEIEE